MSNVFERITTAVDNAADAHGNSFIGPNERLEPATRGNLRALAVAAGIVEDVARKLNDHALIKLYAAARKSRATVLRVAPSVAADPDSFTEGRAPEPEAPKVPTPTPPTGWDAELAKAKAISEVEAAVARIDVASLIAGKMPDIDGMVRDAINQLVPRRIEVHNPATELKVQIDRAHKIFPRVLRYASQRLSPYLVGPAGSGKTTIAEQVAIALGLKFYFAAKVQSEFSLLGFTNATGEYVRTPFRDAYEHGGVFLFDEIDGSNANALTAFNAALANNLCPFPDGAIKRHPDFIAIAAANTFGRGADRQYVGRTAIDAATLDRFAVLEVEYDEQLELTLATNRDWTEYVQATRNYIMDNAIRHVVSPRASINGSKAIAAGDTWQEAADALIWKGLDAETRGRITREVPMPTHHDLI